MSDLFQNHGAKSGPVECLGQTFPSDEARREHYLTLLAEKLKDPEFRKTEGFPIGSDEDILALSDPPYYTACPNPFLNDFLQLYGTPYEHAGSEKKTPFTADVSEGKYDPLYHFHPYHTKVPHKAILQYLLHYTRPGDVVLDAFCGTGMTGVACELASDTNSVREVWKSDRDDGNAEPQAVGVRHCVLADLSPAATFIAYNYVTPVSHSSLGYETKKIIERVREECGWQYQTLHNPTKDQIEAAKLKIHSERKPDLSSIGIVGYVNYTVWSDVFSCPECAKEIVFWDTGVDIENGKVLEAFDCPGCGVSLNKRTVDRVWENKYDPSLRVHVKQSKQVPVLINYTVGGKRVKPKKVDAADLELIAKTELLEISLGHPTNALSEGDKTGEAIRLGITNVHHFYTRRNLAVLAQAAFLASSPILKSLITKVAFRITKRYGLTYQAGTWGAGGGPTNGTLYIPSLVKELNMIEMLESAGGKAGERLDKSHSRPFITTQSTTRLSLPDECIDYIFSDPPFGANFAYSELNFIWESWLSVVTNSQAEAIESKAQHKLIDDYRLLMLRCFKELHRVLKPGRWMTVEFSNTRASVWNSIQSSLQEAGFVVANVSALDKKKGSFNAQTNPTSVKQDLVISAYKPNGGLEDRFNASSGGEESAWDFVKTHLEYLPIVKTRLKEIEFIVERDPRIIFDRMVAWFIGHGVPVPMSTQEFQAELVRRFVLRDGMVFLSDQVTEYDKQRLQFSAAPQMEMFVSDERSAIDWLADFLKRRPSTYQEVSPEFMGQLGAGWKKHETKPELLALLEDNFLKYDGTGEVPSQIHSYLSSNHKDLRGLEKDSPALVAKAKDRWYVPDPNKAQDLEKKREKALLKEFETYKAFTGRKIKESRLEVMRAGFRAAWAAKDYKTILNIANKLPEETLQEDEKLLTLYDLALTRTEDGI